MLGLHVPLVVLRTNLLLCFSREQFLYVVERPVAKIASAFQKPDGLTIVKPDGVIDFLSPLPAGKISGVGRKTEKHLNNLGIHTIGELADADINLINPTLTVVVYYKCPQLSLIYVCSNETEDVWYHSE